jgi:hypothetical protein
LNQVEDEVDDGTEDAENPEVPAQSLPEIGQEEIILLEERPAGDMACRRPELGKREPHESQGYRSADDKKETGAMPEIGEPPREDDPDKKQDQDGGSDQNA